MSYDGFRSKDAEDDAEAKVGVGRRWIRWMHRNRMRDEVLVCSIAVAVWIKWCTGLSSYSGKSCFCYVRDNCLTLDQERRPHQCSVIMRRSGTGWKSPLTFQYANGIHMT